MAAVKKGSYPSRQPRIGPAPLASFEDLPSDELESPDSLLEKCGTVIEEEGSSDGRNPENDLGDSTPGTIVASELSTPQADQFDSDENSQCAVTPSGDKTPISPKTDLLNIEEAPQPRDKKDSVGSLLSPGENSGKPPEECQQRKGSWTDIFRTRSRSRSHSPQGSPCRDSKSPVCQDEHPDHEGGEKKKSGSGGKLFSFLKVGRRKSSSSAAKTPSPPPQSPIEVPSTSVQQPDNEVPCTSISYQPPEVQLTPADPPLTNGKEAPAAVMPSKESGANELEQTKILKAEEIAQELDSLPQLISRRSQFRVAKHESIESRDLHFGIETHSSPCPPTTTLTDEEFTESLDSELPDKGQWQGGKEGEDADIEAENLLNPDSSEYDDFPVVDLQLPIQGLASKTPTRKQRLEVTTCPVERPRSTTPINVAPLEAFIHSATPSPDPNFEKIKLSLPGDQFVMRPKSPKKGGGLKSWQDFCEEGLHSPRLRKKSQGEEMEENIFASQTSGQPAALHHPEKQQQVPSLVGSGDSSKEWVAFDTKDEASAAMMGNGASDPQEENHFNTANNSCTCQCFLVKQATTITTTTLPSANEQNSSSVIFVQSSPPSTACCPCHSIDNPDSISSEDLRSPFSSKESSPVD